MFLSYAVVPVFTLTILLNFFCLHSPIDSQQVVPENYTTCDDCHKSKCYTENEGMCALALDNITFICYACVSPSPDILMFPDEDTCKQSCTDPAMSCVCDGPCFSCMVSDPNQPPPCTVPSFLVDDSCIAIPYGPPADPGTPPAPAAPPADSEAPPADSEAPPEDVPA